MGEKITHQKLKKIYFSQVNEFTKIIDILMKDLNRVVDKSNEMINKDKQKSEKIFLDQQETWLRQANRITITSIEAICFKMKQITLLLFDNTDKNLSQNDREKLSEKKNDGSPRYLRTNENVKFAFKMFAKVLGFPFKIRFDEKWANFLKVIEIRNSLTHPKSSNDLKISVRDHNNTADAFIWFNSLIKQFLNEMDKHKKIKIKLETS
ncbi:MAG: hypothetical protein E3J56_08250 [Candidatus Aminicenantes bacterium]|nr:MAG: hypothetical protein E3J56_08250 [Candidatus Aminicenantes bacterium]